MFETIESHIKAWRIRRQLRLRAAPEGKPHEPAAAAPGTLEQAPVAGGNAGHAHVHFVSPFDTIVEDCATGSSADAQAMARPSPFDTAASAQAAFKAESGEAVALGTRMSSALMSVRTTAEGEVVCNSCPIPDLLPLGGAWAVPLRGRHSMWHVPARRSERTMQCGDIFSHGP